MDNKYKYLAFISYDHRDEKYAKWLHKNLEKRIRLIKYIDNSIVGSFIENTDRKSSLIFIDKIELHASGDLDTAIIQALAESKTLIVICSPNVADNRKYVDMEIKEFHKIGKRKILGLIIDDEYKSDNLNDYYPKSFKELNLNPIYPKIKKDGKRVCLNKILGGIYDVSTSYIIKNTVRATQILGFTALLWIGILVLLFALVRTIGQRTELLDNESTFIVIIVLMILYFLIKELYKTLTDKEN